MAHDEVELWMRRAELYQHRRAMPDVTRDAMRAAVRMQHVRDLTMGAMHGYVEVHQAANAMVHKNPGAEYGIRMFEATAAASYQRILERYGMAW